MNVHELRHFLIQAGIRPSKALGQNFLCDRNIVLKIIRLAQVEPGDLVLEIGPGLGALTKPLLEREARVLAIEKDRRLSQFLQKELGPIEDFTLINADALDYLTKEEREWSNWKLISSLPYSAGTRIIVELLQHRKPPAEMVIVLQKEVARRLLAQHGSSDYGFLSVLTQVRYRTVDHYPISRRCFFPQPEVESMCLKLVLSDERRSTELDFHAFADFLRKAFARPRKKLFKTLATFYPKPCLSEAWQRLGLEPQIRPHQVPQEKYLEMFQILSCMPLLNSEIPRTL